MTGKTKPKGPLPMPQEGGAYVRNPDGSLARAKPAPEPKSGGKTPEE